jgi:hypothetical protein
MFTIQEFTDTKNLAARSRHVEVVFSDGTETLTIPFRFAWGTSVADIKRAVKQVRDELNTTPEDITGAIDDVPTPTPPAPNQDDIDRQNWLTAYRELKCALELEALGVTVSTPQMLTALRTKVGNPNFKREYAELIT